MCVCARQNSIVQISLKKTEFFASFQERERQRHMSANYAWTPCFIFQSSTHVQKETIMKWVCEVCGNQQVSCFSKLVPKK